MDLDGDGRVDVLSGSYSRSGRDMAGLFQVLWGQKGRTWKAAEPLCGSDGEPLILAAGHGEDDVVDKICTRPFACDLDGDGKLDIVSGNFRGTFAFFRGEGSGKFAPKSTLLHAGGEPLKVQAHSDPCCVDWDGDGDLDIVTGSVQGGAYLCANRGSATKPEFEAPAELVPPAVVRSNEPKLGDAHLTGPQRDTRVWVDDVDGDGKLDLLVGDAVRLAFAPKGADEATTLAKLRDWKLEEQKVLAQRQPADGAELSAADVKKWQESYEALQEKRRAIVRDEATGFVWLYRRK